MVKQVFRYLAGRHETAADEPRISQALADFQDSGFHFKEILVSVVKSRDATGKEFPWRTSLRDALGFPAGSFSRG